MSTQLYIFDLDGTLFRGSQVLPDAVETVYELRLRGHSMRYVTNNSAAYPPDLQMKLSTMGFAASLEEICTSGMAAAEYFRNHGLARVFVVGDVGLRRVLEDSGIVCSSDDPQAVLAGICHSFDYESLNLALQHILRGAPFFATNRDATYPLEGGTIQPGAGAIVAAIEACSGEAPIVFGKPEPVFLELISRGTGFEARRCIVVGDRLDTDIEFGRRIGARSYLVLTGDAKMLPEGQWGGETLKGLLD